MDSTRLRLALIHLREHKYNHIFQDSLTPTAVLVMMLKRQLSSFFTVPIIQMEDRLS